MDPDQNAGSAGSASYYAWTPKPGLRFISLDTVSEGTGSVGGAEGNLDNPQYEWLRGQLRRAKAAKQIVVVFGHHPIRRLIVSTPTRRPGRAAAPWAATRTRATRRPCAGGRTWSGSSTPTRTWWPTCRATPT